MVETIWPTLADSTMLTGFAKLTMLNAIKNSVRNSVFIRSVTGECLMMETSTFRPRRFFGGFRLSCTFPFPAASIASVLFNLQVSPFLGVKEMALAGRFDGIPRK